MGFVPIFERKFFVNDGNYVSGFVVVVVLFFLLRNKKGIIKNKTLCCFQFCSLLMSQGMRDGNIVEGLVKDQQGD